MNLPNRLTVSRIIAAFILVGLMFAGFTGAATLSLIVFALASLTDALDGWVARRLGRTTDFGRLVDPLADKILVSGVFISFTALGIVPAWMVVVLVSREFSVTGLRLLAASNGRILAAARGGKQKTVSQMITILVVLAGRAMLADWIPWLGIPADGAVATVIGDFFPRAVDVLMWVTVILTVYSGWRYFRVNRELWIHDA